jgi:hypothetical protein
MDTRILIELRITHEKPLVADRQTIAQLAASGVTAALDGDDPVLLATAQLASAEVLYVEGYGVGFRDGKLTALRVIEGTLPPDDRLHTEVEKRERIERNRAAVAERERQLAGEVTA